jgi:hypothetical protein
VEYFSICSAVTLCIWKRILVNWEKLTMSFVSAISVLAQKLTGTTVRRRTLFASDNQGARIEKNIDRTGDAFGDAAQLLERCLSRSFGI